MRLFGLSFGKHLLIAFVFVLVSLGYFVVAYWDDTFAPILDNVVAMNEGTALVAEIEAPKDLLAYFAEHPATTSVAAFDVDAPDAGIAYGAEVARPVAGLPRLSVLAAYAEAVAEGRLNPNRPVPLARLAAFALPGAGARTHARVTQAWRDSGLVRRAEGDSSVALRRVADAMMRAGDDAAKDWLMLEMGRDTVAAVHRRRGLRASRPPVPSAGRVLAWSRAASEADVERLTALGDAALADSAYRLARRLSNDPAFRERATQRLRTQGAGLTLRQQAALATATYPHGTAHEYARLLAHVAADTQAAAARLMRAAVERRLPRRADAQTDDVPSDDAAQAADSLAARIEAVGSEGSTVPGVSALAGYARRADGRVRVVVLLMEDMPLALMGHLAQTGLDRGFLLRLLADDAFFATARTRLAAAADSTTALSAVEAER
jgi:beta-lactamase class A